MTAVDQECDSSPARRPGRPRDDRVTEAIMAAALRQLADVGYAQLSMESIASDAGVARATVYRRYKDKADVVTAAVESDRAVPCPDSPSAHPRADLIAYLEAFDERFGERCIEIMGSLIGSRKDDSALAVHRERVVEPRAALVRRLLVQAQELGEVRNDIDPDLAVQMLAGAVFARRIIGTTSPPDWAERAVEMIFGTRSPDTH